jgi:hypothetical protein
MVQRGGRGRFHQKETRRKKMAQFCIGEDTIPFGKPLDSSERSTKVIKEMPPSELLIGPVRSCRPAWDWLDREIEFDDEPTLPFGLCESDNMNPVLQENVLEEEVLVTNQMIVCDEEKSD